MASKMPRAKITDLITTVDSEIFASPAGPMVWGAIEIAYISEGLRPQIIIKVPVPVVASQTDEQRRAEALRRARNLINHACVAIEPEPEKPGFREIAEGLAEELGMLPPATAPKRARRT
jgi:hypothetical protein